MLVRFKPAYSIACLIKAAGQVRLQFGELAQAGRSIIGGATLTTMSLDVSRQLLQVLAHFLALHFGPQGLLLISHLTVRVDSLRIT